MEVSFSLFRGHETAFHLEILAGSGGLSVAHQIRDRFKEAGKPLKADDIAIVDAAEYHYYQASVGSICNDCS